MVKMKDVCLVLLLILFAYSSSQGLEVLDPKYEVETLFSLSSTDWPWVKGMTFDSSENLYLVTGHGGGMIYKITPDGVMSQFSGGLSNPQQIAWGGDTSFGNNLYVADNYTSAIVGVGLDGSSSTFSTLAAQPIAVTLDRTGNFGNKMYIGTRNSAGIVSVTDTGLDQPFVQFYGLSDGWPLDIAIDPGTRYGGLMYLTMYSPTDVDWRGMFSVSSAGNITKFLPKQFGWGVLEFDTTEQQDFGGDLFTGAGGLIHRVAPNGDTFEFIRSDDIFIRNFTFGPDNSMYIVQDADSGGPMVISRVSLIPEPATLLMLGIGGAALLRKRRT